MLRLQIPDWIWAFLFGIVVAFVGGAATFKYLPSPLEMFRAVAADCRETAVHKQQKTESREQATQESPPGLQNTQPGNLKNDADNEKAVNECLIARYTGNLASFTRWLVAVTGLLAFFGFWQVMVSRQTAQRQLRAYVFVLNGRVARGMDNRLEATLTIQNSGQTPAYEFISETAIRVAPPELDSGFSEEGHSGQKLSIPPGGEIPLKIFSKGIFSLDDQNRYARNALKIFVFGTLTYRDAFRIKRVTEFRFEVYGDLWGSRGHLRPTQEGNRAT